MIRGYKAYRKGLITEFGERHEVGHIYSTLDGFYLKKAYSICPRLEDTLRFCDGLNEEIDIAIVEGFGFIHEDYDDYYETFSIFVSNIRVSKVLTREEILDYASRLSELQLCKFVAGYRLTENEINFFKTKGEKVRELLDFLRLRNQGTYVKRLNARRTKNS